MGIYAWKKLNRKLKAINLALSDLQEKVREIIMTQAELAKKLNDLGDQVIKVGTESAKSVQLITDLQAQLAAGGPITQEVLDAADRLAAQIKLVDDMVPDAPTP